MVLHAVTAVLRHRHTVQVPHLQEVTELPRRALQVLILPVRAAGRVQVRAAVSSFTNN